MGRIILAVVSFVIVVGTMWWIGFAGEPPDDVVTGAEARELVDAGALLLDVRTPDEFSSGHIDGAVNIPLGDLPDRLDEVEGSVVVYCRSGNRSGQAADLLRKSGHEDVFDLGSISAWDQ